MFSKGSLLVFAIFLLITFEITAGELASNHESHEVKEAKYVDNAREYYMGGLGVGRLINRKLRQSYGPGYKVSPNLPIGYKAVPCCRKHP
ncbi:hypothetical protein QVD17_17175 [Tagetes erecta]|uniref:Uncharacterized protein n=1 Tax=Tagetes erecta TaxID=13708 RepID=A0AAD8P175_TARER|nr:hypothetical protein QVD17_17175 [Tagetes erecta]